MNLSIAIMAMVGVVSSAGGGYLIGAVAGRRIRNALRQKSETDYTSLQEREQRLQSAREQIQQLEIQLTEQSSSLAAAERAREEMRAVMAPLLGQQANVAELQKEIARLADQFEQADRSEEQVEALRKELHRTLAPLLERDRERVGLREVVTDLLGPLLEHERRGQALKEIQSNPTKRGSLPTLLDSIARKGGFAAVLLSDEVGLPLGASAGARNTDVLAGVSSLILTLADRVRASGQPTPVAVLVRDDANQLVLHRIFSAASERFLLTAVSKGGNIAPDALDPALAALERLLDGRSAA